MKFPKYAMIGHTEMRLKGETADTASYYRDAGHWSILVKRVKLGTKTKLTTEHEYPHLNGLRVHEISKKQWLKANEAYL